METTLSDLQVRGDPDEVDSFAACLCAVLEHFGMPAEYSFVEALTGTCFAPCQNMGETCLGWMVDGGNAARVEWMAGVLGLAVETIRLEEPAPSGPDWIDAYRRDRSLPHNVRVYLDRMCAAQMAGSAVIAGTWPAWSVLTGWHDNLALLPFVTTQGLESAVASIFPLAYTRVAFGMRPGRHTLSHKAALREALQHGAQIAAGRVVPRLAGYDGEVLYGSAMYELLAGMANKPNLCPGCEENGCFQRAVKRIHHDLLTSVAFLKGYREYITSGASGQVLENLIEQYEHMQRVTGRYTGLDYSGEIANQIAFRAALERDFSELKVMQIRAAEHFDALAEELLEYSA
jgi:hypothetical protein